jgi:hypothetical protein
VLLSHLALYGARRVVHRLALHCNHTVATYLTVLPTQSC